MAVNAIGRAAQAERRSKIVTIMLALLFVAWVGEASVELDPVLYNGLWRSVFSVFGPVLAPVPMISLTLWQVLLIMIAPVCLASSRPAERSGELVRAILLSGACIVITALWGQLRGGSAYFAYYQVWRFLAALLVAYMLMSVVRTPRDLAALGKLVVVAALIRATLCIYFYWAHIHGGDYFPKPDYVTNHDDSLLFAAATLITASWAFLKGGKATVTTAVFIVLCLFYAMVLNDRRIAWVELAMAFPAIYIMIGPGPLRSRIHKIALATAPVVLLYVAVGWGREGALFAPVQALSSAGSNYDPSSLTRQEEIRNLLYTLTASGNPVVGTGWGIPYIKHESLWSNYSADWILVLYTPHNSLLSLAVYAGFVGIVGIWGVVPIAGLLAARGYKRSTELVPRVAAMASIGALAAYSVHCYGDVGLYSLQCNLILGVALAAAGKVAAWSQAIPATQAVTATVANTTATPSPRPTYGGRGATGARRETPPRPPRPAGGTEVAAKRSRVPPRQLSR